MNNFVQRTNREMSNRIISTLYELYNSRIFLKRKNVFVQMKKKPGKKPGFFFVVKKLKKNLGA